MVVAEFPGKVPVRAEEAVEVGGSDEAAEVASKNGGAATADIGDYFLEHGGASIRRAYISSKKGCSSRERSKMRGRVVVSILVEGASADIVGCEVGESFFFVSETLANKREAW